MKSGEKKNKSISKEKNFWGKVCEIYTKMWAECHKFSNCSAINLDQLLFNVHIWLKFAKLIKTNTWSHTCQVFGIQQREIQNYVRSKSQSWTFLPLLLLLCLKAHMGRTQSDFHTQILTFLTHKDVSLQKRYSIANHPIHIYSKFSRLQILWM